MIDEELRVVSGQIVVSRELLDAMPMLDWTFVARERTAAEQATDDERRQLERAADERTVAEVSARIATAGGALHRDLLALHDPETRYELHCFACSDDHSVEWPCPTMLLVLADLDSA